MSMLLIITTLLSVALAVVKHDEVPGGVVFSLLMLMCVCQLFLFLIAFVYFLATRGMLSQAI